LALADKGYARAFMSDPCLREGLNIYDGQVTHKAVADALGMPYVPANEALKI
jgi:alanine dehydrogenase